MKQMDDESVDLIITSPPYNIGGDFHTMVNGKRVSYGDYNSHNDNMSESSYQEWQINVLNECYRVLKKEGNMFYNHKNRLIKFKCISPLLWVLKTKFIFRQEIIWDTTNEINQDNRRFIPCHEKIFWLSKNITHINNKLRLQDCWVFRNKLKRKDTGHPAVMAIDVVKNILNMFDDGLTVFDPFSGHGTTAAACLELGFNFIGTEIDDKYCMESIKRIDRIREQKTLF